jgi:hypothetical protein
VRTDPAANRWKRACKLDELYGFPKFPFDCKAHKPLHINMRRAGNLTRRGLLFLSSRLARHSIAAVTLLTVHENHAGLGVLGNRLLGTGQGTGRIFTMVTKQGLKIGSPLNRLDHLRADTEAMLLFASHFAGMATHTFIFIQH